MEAIDAAKEIQKKILLSTMDEKICFSKFHTAYIECSSMLIITNSKTS